MSTSSDRLLQCLSLLNACTNPSHLKQLHAHAAKSGLSSDPVVSAKLLLSYAITFSETLDYACRLFSSIPCPDSFIYNTLIRGLSESDHPSRSIALYTDMRRSCVAPDSFSFAFALKGAANSRSLGAGRQLHSHVFQHGFDAHLFVGTTLVSLYGENGCLHDARKAFDDMLQPNIVGWNAVLRACCQAIDMGAAEDIFAQMPWRNQMSWNIMLAGYAKCGEMGYAKKMFVAMPQRDQVSWNTMITGFAGNGWFEDAFTLFRELLRLGVLLNAVSLTGTLSSCAQAGAFEFGKVLHGYINKSGHEHSVSVANALLDTYAKCGQIEMARKVFDCIKERKSIITWTSMIAGLAMQGYGEKAIKVFHEMELNGIKPDGITFISILYACSHAGLVDKGYDYFCKMETVYGIERSIEHYGCVVDLYGRAGFLDQAYEFIKRMPMKPNDIIWRTLLGACSIHGSLALAEHVKKQLSELRPSESTDYILLFNIFAGLGKWKDAADIRRSMKEQKMRKSPGWSTIEIDKSIYLFVANAEPNGATEEAHKKLLEIMMRIKAEGYEPGTGTVLYNIEEEEKQDTVYRHSEKLAVAFGIARIFEGSVIRIVKNLRVCHDCHTVMKLISKVYGRHIVLRDRSRFHCFREGSCSCSDYW